MTETLSPPAEDKDHKKVYTHVSNRKSRTGCSTCKTRHLKSDETKPDCLRCLRFEGHCDGYPTPKQKSTSSKLLPSPSKSVMIRKFIKPGGKRKRYALAQLDGEKSFPGDEFAIFRGREEGT